MLFLLIEKELKNLLLSPKFVATFGACTILIVISILAGIFEFHANTAQHDAAAALVDQELTEASTWSEVGMRNRVYRPPHPMQIFVSGVSYDIGRFSVINSYRDIKLQQSAYSIEPIFAVFRLIDFVFIVQVVLSLITIVFAYDLVSGEKESGTLRLMLSNAIPRAKYIMSKVAGAWIGLMAPLIIPMALGLLLVLLYRVPLEAAHWGNLVALIGFSMLYITAYLCIGALVSSLTQRSSTSFLILLVIWIVMVLVIPRSGMMLSEQVHPVPSVSELESRKQGYAQERREQFTNEIMEIQRERMAAMEELTQAEREAYREDQEWDWMVQSEELINKMEADIADYNRRVNEDATNRKAQQHRFGFALSRISLASAYQLAAMNLGQTDLELKQRYEQLMETYRTTFTDYIEQKNPGGMFSFSTTQQAAEPLDLSDMPQFETPRAANILNKTLVDAAVLLLYTIIAFGLSVTAFNRYDVR